MYRCQSINQQGHQCLRKSSIKKNSKYCWQHKNQNFEGKNFGGEISNKPIIEIYEFKIQNYSQQINSFSSGFYKSAQCGRILANNKDVLYQNKNLSSCDLIDSNMNLDWESSMNEKFGENYGNDDFSVLRLIKDVYYEYKEIPSKSNYERLKENQTWKKFCQKWGPHLLTIIDSIEKRYELYFNSIGLDIQLIKSYSYIYRIHADISEKIVMMGDFHGSMHTFLRHLFRFDSLGIIDLMNLKVLNGYKLIFLGDVIDRGSFSLEITLIIMKLMEINNLDLDNPSVIYNRGNHEHDSLTQKHGFQKEIFGRCLEDNQWSKKIYQKITGLYEYLSSAVILHIGKSYKYWLCHGGFDPNMINPDSELSLTMLNVDQSIIPFTDKYQQENVRWSDFDNYDESESTRSNEKRGIGFVYNKSDVYQFCKVHNIDFIIRGHQDSLANNYLFSANHMIPYNDRLQNNIHVMPGLGLNYADGFGASIMGKKGQIVKYNQNFSQIYHDRSKGPIVKLLASSKYYLIDNSKLDFSYYYGLTYEIEDVYGKALKIYPVLTISTNTDLKRPLMADSFIILQLES